MQSKSRIRRFFALYKCIPLRCIHIIIVSFMICAGCSTFSKEETGGPYAQIVEGSPEIIITGLEVQENGEWCSDFTLNTSDVIYFFRHVREVTGPEYSVLDWYPCIISGQIITKKGVYSWNINASGNGHVTHPDDTFQVLHCETCIYGGE